MPKEGEFEPMRYICPICGEKTRFGEHFCAGRTKSGENKPSGRFGKIGATAIAVFLIVALLWGSVGILSLIVPAAFALAAALILGLRKLSRNSSAEEYRMLVGMTGGDRAAADRLIALEGRRHPGQGREECVREVMRQWRRDF